MLLKGRQLDKFTWFVPFIYLFIYLMTLASHHNEAEDALAYAFSVSQGDALKLFHPNHLLFETFSFWFHKLLSIAFSGIHVITSMQILQSISGALVLWISLRVMESLGMDSFWQVFSAICIGSAYGFWAYSVEADTYVLPILFLMLAVQELLKVGQGDWGYPRFLLMATFLSLATLVYQQHVLAFLVFFVPLAVFCLEGKLRFSMVFTRLATMYGVAALLVGGGYLSVAFFVPSATDASTLGEAVVWSLGHGSKGTFVEFGASSFLKSMVGLFKAIWGVNFLFGYDSFVNYSRTLFPGLSGFEETYMAATLNPWVKGLALATLVFGLLSFAACIVLIVLRGAIFRDLLKNGGYIVFALTFLMVYAIFNTVYYPENLEFWIAVVPILFILMGFILSKQDVSQNWLRPVFAVVSLGMLIPNAIGSIIPQSFEEGDFWKDFSQYYVEETFSEDRIIVHCGYGCAPRLHWWSPSQVHHFDEIEFAELESMLSRTDPDSGRILVSSWVLNPPQGLVAKKWDADPEEEEKRRLLNGYSSNMLIVHRDKIQTIYQLDFSARAVVE